MNWNDVQDFQEVRKNDLTIRGKIVGLSFIPGYPNNLYTLFNGGGSRPTTLKRNPENQYDSNATEIHVDSTMVGHLPRDLAAEIAPKLDAGGIYTMTTSLLVTPGKEGNPGLAFQLLFKEV